MGLMKKDWILLLLSETPMDRIHIMKALFLIWIRSGRKIPDYFEFVAYLYGPCSFEVYTQLDELQASGFIVQPPHPMPQWVKYYLTDTGKKDAEKATQKLSSKEYAVVKSVANQVSKLSFNELLRNVYTEAPEFAKRSMFRGILR